MKPPPRGTQPRLCIALTAGTLAAALLVLHWPVLTHGLLVTPAGMHHAQWPWKAFAAERIAEGAVLEDNSTLSDLLFEVYPWQWHIQRSLGGGAIPLWNPYSYCGVPFVANAQSAVFYPLHWPAWVFPSMRVFTVAVLLKVLLAGTFMAVFLAGRGLGPAACVVGSVSFALGGFMTSWLGYAHTNAAIALPLLMHAAGMLARSPGADGLLLFAVAGAAQYLGGHPETSLHIVGASVLYFLWLVRGSPRRAASVGLLVAAGALGVAIASVQLLPFLEYLMSSVQLLGRQATGGLDPALPAEAPVTLLLPGLYGWPWARTYSGPAAFQAVTGYAGAGVLLLAGLATRWIRGAGFLALLGATSAAAVYGPPAIRSALGAIPVVGLGNHNRLLLLMGFCLAALAAIAVDRLGDAARGRHLAWLAILTVLALAVIALHWDRDPQGARLASAVVAGTAVMAALAALRPSRRAIYTAGIAAITAGDMIIFAYGFNPHADPRHLFPPTPLTDFVRQDAAADMTRGGRMMTVGWTMRPEIHLIYHLSSVEGFDAMEKVPYRQLLDRAQVAAIHLTGHVPDEPRRLLDLMSLRHVVTPPEAVVSGEGFTLAYDGPDGRVFVNERALPRLSFVTRAVAAPEGPLGALDLLATGRADPGREVVLQAEDMPATDDPGEAIEQLAGPEPTITLERNAPADLMVRVGGHTRPGYLVVADAYDRGWRAEVNGRPEPVLRANHTFRAVRIPAGEAVVRLAYRPFSFVAGAWISAVSLLCLLGVGLMRWGAVHTGDD